MIKSSKFSIIKQTCQFVWVHVHSWSEVKCKSLSHVWLFVTQWTIQSMEFSRPEYWSGWPSTGDRPNPGIEPRSPRLQADSFPAEPSGKPKNRAGATYPFSSRSSRPRNWTGVSCIAGGLFTNSAIREAPDVQIYSHVCIQIYVCIQM